MVVWPGSGRMKDGGRVMLALRFPCITTHFSSTGMFLLLVTWLLYGSQELEMQRLKLTITVVERLITLPRCFRMGMRGTISVGWSTLHAGWNQIVAWSSNLLNCTGEEYDSGRGV
jgi:hypothetical protein